jgi:hypothetical protein
MATTTPNFGWPVPTSTDLVKDGATAIESLGDSIDASLLDLKGGTSGQVLSKNSNSDMDFTWVTSDDANAIQNTIVDAKGDLIAASASDTPARLAVGADDLLLTAASGETTGLKYTGGWTSYTPTWGNLTVGNGTVIARYQKIGKIVNVYVGFVFGSTSSISGGANFTVPFPIATNNSSYQFFGEILDGGTADYAGCIIVVGAGNCYISALNAGTTFLNPQSISATVPFTWVSGDGFQFLFSYEVA